MTTFLQILGVLSLLAGFAAGFSALPNAGAFFAGIVSGLVSMTVFWWMAAVLRAVRGTEESVKEAAEVLKQIAQAGLGKLDR